MKPRVIILGAGRPYRGDPHSSLRLIDGRSKVLDWILHAFGQLHPVFSFVGGYRVEDVIKQYPHILYLINKNWRTTGSVGSLLSVDLDSDRDHYVCYSDIIFRDVVVERMAQVREADVVVAVDTSFPSRYASDPAEDPRAREKSLVYEGRLVAPGAHRAADALVGEFIGLIRLSGAAVSAIEALKAKPAHDLGKMHLSALVDELSRSGLDIAAVDVRDDWTDLNSPFCVARFIFGTKAETLDRLQQIVRNSSIEAQVRFTVEEWRASRSKVLAAVRSAFSGGPLAVRSSSTDEDTFETASAGAYYSRLHVRAQPESIAEAVDAVIASFRDNHPAHQVFVQRMVSNVRSNGVAFTRLLRTGAPYYSFNFVQDSDTSRITAGTSREHETILVFRERPVIPAGAPRGMAELLEAVREIEYLVDYDALDIEYAITDAPRPCILQVRPILIDDQREESADREVAKLLASAEEQFAQINTAHPWIKGKRTMLGLMPDWNPAEIIGTRPGLLAFSLYDELITGSVWATQRAQFGYRDVRPCPLVRLYAGHPYVDVRASLNSFVPASLSDTAAEQLVDHCLDYLEAHPDLHDKIEFQVIPTCYTFNFDTWITRLEHDIAFPAKACRALCEGLREITRNAFQRCALDLRSLDILASRFEAIDRGVADPLTKAFALLDDCRANGTLPFAHLARAAFIAISLLRTAATQSLIDERRVHEFLESLDTVSRRFRRDAMQVKRGLTGLDAFIAQYGHLRPGTYDIVSESYAENPSKYLEPAIDQAVAEDVVQFVWTPGERRGIEQALRREDLGIEFPAFDSFLRLAIEGREFSKFVFTRNLSRALTVIAQYGATIGLDRAALACLHLSDLRCATLGAATASNMAEFLVQRAEEGTAFQAIVQQVELPPLICRPEEFYRFRHPHTRPNFVTTKRAMGTVVNLSAGGKAPPALHEKIVLIAQADPGYDWLFSHGISGLITAYGGANSHMAVRAAELGLPAAIGVGETRFRYFESAKSIDLNCAAKQILVTE